jgi:hypothetical protein
MPVDSNSVFYTKIRCDLKANSFWLGTSERLLYPYLVRMYVPAGGHGEAAYMYSRFKDEEEWVEFEKKFMSIKRVIAKYNDAHGKGRVDDEQLKKYMEGKWIPLVDRLVNDYGNEFGASGYTLGLQRRAD